MLSLCEAMNSRLVQLALQIDKDPHGITMGQIARAKAHATLKTREVVSLARECLGGNGIIGHNRVMRNFLDLEVMYTGEGTYDVNSLVSARELTGGLSAFK